MPISFPCTACRHAMEVSRRFAGKRGKCPRCGTVLRIPELLEARQLSADSDQVALADIALSDKPSGRQPRPDSASVRQRWQSAHALGDERNLDPELSQGKLQREVAVKKLLPEKTKDTSRAAFIAESLVTAWLDHPNIVPIYDLTESAKGEVELAMKIVGGTSWKDLLRPKTPDHEERAAKYKLEGHLGILLAVCNAVAFAHSRGIAHLDLKPTRPGPTTSWWGTSARSSSWTGGLPWTSASGLSESAGRGTRAR